MWGGDDHVLYCDDKRTSVASKKTCVLSAVPPERCETVINSIRRTVLHWRGPCALMAQGVRGMASEQGSEQRRGNWDPFGRAVTQYNCFGLGSLALFLFIFF